MNGFENYHIKENKPDTERHKSHVFSHIWSMYYSMYKHVCAQRHVNVRHKNEREKGREERGKEIQKRLCTYYVYMVK